MAIRKIGINCRSMARRQGFYGRQYESALEGDLLDLLSFDPNNERYETQPVKLYYDAENGGRLPYTPDALNFCRLNVPSVWDLPHLLLVLSCDKKRWVQIFAELCI